MSIQPAPLEREISHLVLKYLGLPTNHQPDLNFLDRLVSAYTQKVPWESASRITRRAYLMKENNTPLDSYPRWPAEFWRQAIEEGGGGTCYETNYAFFSLLLALGYEGYLTINNMGDSIGCHSAIILTLSDRKWLVDVGLPLYAPLPLDLLAPSNRESAFHRYTVRPDGPKRYQVERDRHPQPNCFTLIDSPVNDSQYRAITAADYGPGGFFLDRVVITKVIGHSVWRFNSGDKPYRLEQFVDGRKVEYPLEGQKTTTDSAVVAISGRFNLSQKTIAFALATLLL